MITHNPGQLKWLKFISILLTVMGIVLMAFMITVEDEPGAIPLLMIVAGTAGYFISRPKLRSQNS